MREFEVERICAQFDFVIPPDLAMIPDTHILKEPIVVPNTKDAFSDESGQVNLASGAVSEFKVKVITGPRFNQSRLYEFVHKKQY